MNGEKSNPTVVDVSIDASIALLNFHPLKTKQHEAVETFLRGNVLGQESGVQCCHRADQAILVSGIPACRFSCSHSADKEGTQK